MNLIGMAPKRGRGRPPKRAAPEAVADAGPAHGDTVPDVAQADKDREIERLRAEIQRLQEATRDRSQASSTSLPVPAAPESRKVARMTTGEGEVSLKEFLSYGTPEFRGELGEDPQEFLEECTWEREQAMKDEYPQLFLRPGKILNSRTNFL